MALHEIDYDIETTEYKEANFQKNDKKMLSASYIMKNIVEVRPRWSFSQTLVANKIILKGMTCAVKHWSKITEETWLTRL